MANADTQGALKLKRLLLLALSVALFLLFASLGKWQLERREWKLALIEQVENQLQQPAQAAPGPNQWPALTEQQAYSPVTLKGRYLHSQETFVQAMTAYGSGYWLLTPLITEQGFIAFVNRGFVDAQHKDPATRLSTQQDGLVEVNGLLRLSEPNGRILQANQPSPDDPELERWYSRDIAAIADVRELPALPVAPYFIDAKRVANAEQWPVAGLTVVQFRNSHLSYAITWFALAILCVVGVVLILRDSKHKGVA